MITVMDSVKETMKNNPEKCLDPQLWHACAGGMVQMPLLNSKVYYFPQGHAENAYGNVDFGNFQIPSCIPCRVSAIKYMADTETDEVYVKTRLVPLKENDFGYGDIDGGFEGNNGTEGPEKSASFAKTLTQSDANNGGGFSVPRYCAETIFPKLDYSAEPPVQNILAKDVHGEVWKFRHIYRGTPRRHLLTTGWSNFVNQKKLVAGDSIVFLRAENGDLCVGIRRAKRGMGGGPEYAIGWNPVGGNYSSPFGGYSGFPRDDENKLITRNSSNGDLRGRVRPESVVQAAMLAASGQPFEVVYYPRAGTPEFCIKASAVRAAMQIQWCPGMRFKMAFETEDSSRISWFMGTVSSVQVSDPIHWPNSPWRILEVSWDEPDLLQNVKRVSPWLVELVPNIPAIHLSPFTQPRKKLRLPQHGDFSQISQVPVPSFSNNNNLRSSSPLCCISDNLPGGVQGARHAQYVGLSTPDHSHFRNLQPGLFPLGFGQLDHHGPSRICNGSSVRNSQNNGNLSCWLTMGNPTQTSKHNNETKLPHILLFGKLILTEQQNSQSCSGDTTGNSSSDGNPQKTAVSSDGSGSAIKTAVSSDGSGSAINQNGPQENSSDGGSPWCKNHRKTDLNLEIGHCKVFMESEDVGRTLDLSALGSYEELYRKLENMFGIDKSEMLSNVQYWDAAGSVKHTGDQPFSEFLKTARRLTILTDSSSDNRTT